MKIKGTIGAKKLSIESSRQSWHDGHNQKSFANQQTCHKQNTNMQDKQARQASERTEIAAVHWSRERRPEHRTRNGTGTDRNAHTRNARATSAAFAASICISSSWQKCRWQCTWPHHLHFEPPAKCKWDFCQNSYLDKLRRMAAVLFNPWSICILLLSQNATGNSGLWEKVMSTFSGWK